ncbi:MAG: YsnF/AvaK domain-containing protein [Rhodothermales bacterium]
MAKTIVGLYDDRVTAHRVVEDLEERGFGDEHLRYASYEKGKRSDYEVDAEKNTTPDALTGYGVPQDESEFYAEAVRRGGALVIARVHDQDAETAADIMARHNPVPFGERHEAYKKEGFTGYTETEPYDQDEIVEERERYADRAQARFKEIEEQLKIGKREVVRGGVRVHKYVDTDMVEETLRLRDEEIHVDRERVDRKLTPEEADAAFREDEIELVERDEEAVVSKEARVTGEVAVGKEVREREETVGGEVRSTRVEVEETGGTQTTGAVKWVDVEPDFRTHYEGTFKGENDYAYYEPAYRYGYEMANDKRYRELDFGRAEGDIRKGYVHRHDEGLWDETKDAVRHAYNSVRRAF